MIQAANQQDLQRLKTLDVPIVSDAIEAFKLRDATEGFTGSEIRCLTPQLGPMLGYAVTAVVDCMTPGPRPGKGKQPELWQLLERSPLPAVLVFAHGEKNIERASVLGDIVARTALRLGAAGLVTNAAVRDLEPTAQLGFKVFARGTVVSRANNTTLSIGGDVQVSGMHVRMGDLIFGDANGCVVIPKEIALADLFREIEAAQESERRRVAVIEGPDFTAAKLG